MMLMMHGQLQIHITVINLPLTIEATHFLYHAFAGLYKYSTVQVYEYRYCTCTTQYIQPTVLVLVLSLLYTVAVLKYIIMILVL